MSGIFAALKGTVGREEPKPPPDPDIPQHSECIRIQRDSIEIQKPIVRQPCPQPHEPPSAHPAGEGRRKQTETSAEVRLISALVFSLYQIRISDPAVLCTATAFCLTRDCPRWKVKLMTGALAKPNLPRIDNVLIVQTGAKHPIYVDFEWRERYRLKRTVPVFDQWFNSVSPVMVAPEASLLSQIKHNCLHCRNCFLALGMEIPPWRRPEALITAYLSSPEVAIDVRPLCGYLMETLPGSEQKLEGACEDYELCGRAMSGCDACSDHDSSDDEHLPQTRIMEVNGKQQAKMGIAKGIYNRLTPNRELDADGSSESEDTSASFESQAKYDAPPVLTALTEMYQDGKHAYMCVEYSQAMKADAAIANETQSSLSARKGLPDADVSTLRKRALSVDGRPLGVLASGEAEPEGRKEVAMAELLAEPNLAFLHDLNVQQLVEQTGTNPECVIKAVPPYPFTKEEMRAARQDQPRRRRLNAGPNGRCLSPTSLKRTTAAAPCGRRNPRFAESNLQQEEFGQKQYAASVHPPQRMKHVDVLPLNSMPQRPLVWAHVDNRPIYAPAITNDLRQLLLAHVPSSYIPLNQSFSLPMYHLVRDSQHSAPWSSPAMEEYGFEKSSQPTTPLPEVSGLAQQLSRISPSPPRRFAFWW